MKKKIKYSSVVYLKKSCPKCKSDNVAEISISQFTERENKRIAEENFRHDLQTYFVSPEDYKRYYLEYHLNTRCLDCKYEYFSKTEKINRKVLEKEDEIIDIEDNSSSNDLSESKTENMKKDSGSKLSRILKILRE